MKANKLSIIVLATVFNLLFEYSVGGVNRLVQRPLTILWLFFIYFCLFSMLEDLIRRFRITNLEVAVFAVCFGIFPELYLTGSIFTEPLVLGINWESFVTINVVWWGTLQSLVTLYFANRLVPRRWEDERYMGWLGWVLCIAYIAFLCAVSMTTSDTLRRGPVVGYAIASAVQVCGAAYLVLNIDRREPRAKYAFEPHPLLDLVAFGSVAAFLLIGTFVAGTNATSQEGNVLELNSLLLATLWTFMVFAGVLAFYAWKRRPIAT